MVCSKKGDIQQVQVVVVNPLHWASGQLCKHKSGTHWWAAALQKWFMFDGESEGGWHVVSWGANTILRCI